MEETMQLVVNGQPREISASETPMLADVLSALNLKADRIAVEHNGKIARRTAWGETPVRTGDRLEIVHFVGGGLDLLSEPAGNSSFASTLQNMCYRT